MRPINKYFEGVVSRESEREKEKDRMNFAIYVCGAPKHTENMHTHFVHNMLINMNIPLSFRQNSSIIYYDALFVPFPSPLILWLCGCVFVTLFRCVTSYLRYFVSTIELYMEVHSVVVFDGALREYVVPTSNCKYMERNWSTIHTSVYHQTHFHISAFFPASTTILFLFLFFPLCFSNYLIVFD